MKKLIIFPTDTVYGIGCNIFDIQNIYKIYEIKHRSFDKPLACLCADREQIDSIAIIDDVVTKLIETFMPGALTIILKSKPVVYETLSYPTIGVRIPNSNFALDILHKMGPMLTTSVNDSGQAPMNEYEDIKRKYQNVVDIIYPPVEKSSHLASTVISYLDGELQMIREGQVTLAQIKTIINA